MEWGLHRIRINKNAPNIKVKINYILINKLDILQSKILLTSQY